MTNLNCEMAVLTPAGRGAVATILISGKDAGQAVDQCFQPKSWGVRLEECAGRALLGQWIDPRDPTSAGEDVVVSPRDLGQFEVHCHGGPAVTQRILAVLGHLGAIASDWQSHSQSTEGTLAREARQALTAARSQRTAAILLDQWRGALAREARACIESIEVGQTDQAREKLSILRDRSGLGLHLTQPWQLAIYGPPNVGKSSLLNALVGYERSITSPLPGTTRDVLTSTVILDGWPVELADTAGLRNSDDELEAAGIALAQGHRRRADLQILVLDASSPVSASQLAETQMLCERSDTMVVWNKVELPCESDEPPLAGLRLSALTGQGLEAFIAELSHRLVPSLPAPGDAVPFTSRQVRQIDKALDLLRSRDTVAAVASLAELAH